jgi:hypothetical protein
MNVFEEKVGEILDAKHKMVRKLLNDKEDRRLAKVIERASLLDDDDEDAVSTKNTPARLDFGTNKVINEINKLDTLRRKKKTIPI